MDALEQLKSQDYVKKLKMQITSESMPSDSADLVAFLYDQVTGHAAIFIYKCPVIPRKRLYINAHPTGVRNSYVIMTARLRLDRIWHQCALSIFG